MAETNHAAGDAHKVALVFITQEMLGNADIEVAMTSNIDRSVAARRLRAFADKLENLPAGKPASEEDPPVHPVDEAWEYLDRVAYMVDGDPHLEFELLKAARDRLVGVGHLVRDDEKGAWGATGNLLIRLIANRQRMNGHSEVEPASPDMTLCVRCGAGGVAGCDIPRHHPLCQIDGKLTNLSDDEVRKVLNVLKRHDCRIVEAASLKSDDFDDVVF